MPLRLLNRDVELLRALADHSLLTIEQVVHLHGMSGLQVARRRVGRLETAGLVRSRDRQFARRRGRPEKILSVGPEGIAVLRQRSLLPECVPEEELLDPTSNCEGHQLLLNWFRIHLAHLPSVVPQLTVDFQSPDSPFSPEGERGRPQLREELRKGGNSPPAYFVPDGVFRVGDSETGKNALFFLEIDMGTEPLASRRPRKRDLRTKILNYQAYSRGSGFRKYGELWGADFQGFRVLIMTCASSHRAAICRLVSAMAPTDYVWISDAARMFCQGLGDAIWHRGGDLDTPLESILGSRLCCRTPLPSLHR